jgi:hypothetical protein
MITKITEAIAVVLQNKVVCQEMARFGLEEGIQPLDQQQPHYWAILSVR